MDRNEMIKVLMEKANITEEEANQALDKCNGELLDTIVYLEREGRLKDSNKDFHIEDKKEGKQDSEYCEGIGAVLGRVFRGIGRIIKKGNENYFEIKKENEKPIRVTLTVSAILLIVAMPMTMILLIIGLLCGYKYSISGKGFDCSCVNSAFEGVSKSFDNIKNDFKEGYNK